MNGLRLPPLSLYIHIPWCERKCPYCDFNSHEMERALPERAYVAALLADLEQDLIHVQDRELQSIFIGGGTPSLFGAGAIDRLLRGVRSRTAVAEDAEITLEANPGSAEAEKFEAFVAAGVNRISLGIQSFDDRQLGALGRIHDGEQALAAVEAARRCELRSFNLDLMHGLPEQGRAGAAKDLEIACAQAPPHLSWYQLTIEPNTAFYKRPPPLPAERVLAGIQESGEALLEASGFAAYEVSAYAKPGHQCRHNLNYWRFGDYIGIGAGAHGKLSRANERKVIRTARIRRPERYLERPGGSYLSELREPDGTDLLREYMLNALRPHRGFTLAEFHRRTGLPASAIEARLEDLCSRNLLTRENGRVRATPLGRRFLDSVIGEFF